MRQARWKFLFGATDVMRRAVKTKMTEKIFRRSQNSSKNDEKKIFCANNADERAKKRD